MLFKFLINGDNFKEIILCNLAFPKCYTKNKKEKVIRDLSDDKGSESIYSNPKTLLEQSVRCNVKAKGWLNVKKKNDRNCLLFELRIQ